LRGGLPTIREAGASARAFRFELEASLDYEIEVQELKDRRRGMSRLALGAVVTAVLVLVLRHLM